MIGQTLGSFRILSELGTGGMGVIYQAEHQIIGKRAAIKVLRPEMSRDREIVGRFFNEAKAVTAIDHPGLVDVYDFGYTSDGSAYIVMELLAGESLAGRLRREHPLPVDLSIALMRQLCGALGAAHERHIVHRDLKPDNIFLVPDPDVAFGVRAKVLDFGIAKLAPELGGLGPETRTGMLLGTPMYMAPEQCRGAGEVDHRADIYALGVILFEMVCGCVPFTGAGLGEVIAKHQYVAPPIPRSLVPSLPASLEALILRMLAKEPEHRPQSMHEIMHALDGRVATTNTVATIAPPRSDVHAATPVTMPRRRPPWRLIIGVLAGVAAVTATGMILRGTRRPDATFEHLDVLPADTELVAALDVTKLEDTDLWQRLGPTLLATIDQNDPDRMLTQVRLRCDLDLARDLHWVMFAIDSSATHAGQGALIVNGAWSREKLEHCVAELNPTQLGQPLPLELQASKIQRYGDLWIRWIAPDTAALSFSGDSVEMLGRIAANASRASGRTALQRVVDNIDHAAVVWIAGAALRDFPHGIDPSDSGVLDHASEVSVSLTLGELADLHVAFTEPPGQAAVLERAFVAALARVRGEEPLFDQLHATTHGDVLAIDAHLDGTTLGSIASKVEYKLRIQRHLR